MNQFFLWLALWAGAVWVLLHLFTDDEFDDIVMQPEPEDGKEMCDIF